MLSCSIRRRLSSLPILAVAASVFAAAQAQELPFRSATTNDRVGLSRSMHDLAIEALSTQPGSRRALDPGDQVILQLAAQQYVQAKASLAAWRAQHSAQPGLDPPLWLRLYAEARAAESQDKVPFGEAFRKAFASAFAPLDDRSAFESRYFLETLPSVFRARLEQLLSQRNGSEWIALADAVTLVRAYLTTEAFECFAADLTAAETADDAQRYLVNDAVLIKTQEGATLSALVVRKRGVREPQPTSLRFTIYVQPRADLTLAELAALHGYVGVVAYARGKRASPDEISPWEHEVADTYGVIDWISKQPWSNGEVGMYGASYEGFTQWAAAKRLHPALKTIVPGSASSPGLGLPMQNNVFLTANYAWPFYVMDNRELDDATYNDRQRWNAIGPRWFASGRPFRQIDAIDGMPNHLLQRQLQHPSFDAYYQAMQPHGDDYARINIPVLTMTGYYDDANSAAVNYLVEHYEHDRNARHYLLIGPYPHASSLTLFTPPVVAGYTLDPAARIDSLELTYQWFDHVMRGTAIPALLQDRINFEIMGANRWAHAPSIDAMSSEKQLLYLSDERVGGRYRLSPKKAAQLGFIEQTVDLADRTSENNLYPGAAVTTVPALASGFLYVSDPLDATATLSGKITGKLDIAINKRDLDITLAAGELMADGKVFWLCYYVGRASYADDMSVRKLLTPGERTAIPFTRTQLVSRQVSKGSRLLVVVSVNKNPFAQVNYGTGKDVSDESVADAGEPLKISWYNDSFVTVPISR